MALRMTLGLLSVPLAFVSACAPELYKRSGILPLHKRAEGDRFWTYATSSEWNTLDAAWGYCNNGTQQSPIAYQSWMGSSAVHQPHFSYPDSIMGSVSNWDFGPQFAYDGHGKKPSMHFEENGKNVTVYFKSWHIHTPAEHTIDGWKPRAEMHFVHYDANDNPRAVVGFMIDRHAQSAGSEFFSQLGRSPDFRENRTVGNVTINLNHAISEVLGYTDFFTYQGSLTTPPCSEGLRWFVAKEPIWMSDMQMQDLLTVSTFSSRPTNDVWLHNVNV